MSLALSVWVSSSVAVIDRIETPFMSPLVVPIFRSIGTPTSLRFASNYQRYAISPNGQVYDRHHLTTVPVPSSLNAEMEHFELSAERGRSRGAEFW